MPVFSHALRHRHRLRWPGSCILLLQEMELSEKGKIPTTTSIKWQNRSSPWVPMGTRGFQILFSRYIVDVPSRGPSRIKYCENSHAISHATPHGCPREFLLSLDHGHSRTRLRAEPRKYSENHSKEHVKPLGDARECFRRSSRVIACASPVFSRRCSLDTARALTDDSSNNR